MKTILQITLPTISLIGLITSLMFVIFSNEILISFISFFVFLFTLIYSTFYNFKNISK